MDKARVSVEKGDLVLRPGSTSFPFSYLRDGSTLHFEDFDFGTGADTLDFKAATPAKGEDRFRGNCRPPRAPARLIGPRWARGWVIAEDIEVEVCHGPGNPGGD